jgi:Flp pilus assembly secretin CpaC
MPLLGDIPILGWLFKTKGVNRTKTNLVVFITPHVVKQSERLAELTKNKHKDFAMAGEQYAQGELLVKFKEGVTPEQAEQIISQQGASVIKVIQLLGVYHIRLRKDQAVEEAVQEFSKIPEVHYAEPNYKMKLP